MSALVEHLTRVVSPGELGDLLRLFGGRHHYLPTPERCPELLAVRDGLIQAEHAAGVKPWKIARRYMLSRRQVLRIIGKAA